MTWQVDYFMICDICQNVENMDGRTKAQATKTAREKGWFVSKKETHCPKCQASVTKWQQDARKDVLK